MVCMTTNEQSFKAVRFTTYGGPEVLTIDDVPVPAPGPGEVLVRVRAAGINPGEIAIREGVFHDRWPATFPSGQGSDFAGVVEAVGEGVDAWAAGDEVLGFTHDRRSQAELVVAEADHLTAKPAGLSWEVAGSLFVTGTTAYAATRAVAVGPGQTVVVSAAAGGVGTLAVQLLVRTGARVIGLASEPNHGWLREHGVEPLTYGDGVADRIRAAAPDGVDAFADLFGAPYVDLALELGVPVDRINTIKDFPAVQAHGVRFEGNNDAASAEVLAELAALVASGELEAPVAATYPLDRVRDAYAELAERHTRGKIVLIP